MHLWDHPQIAERVFGRALLVEPRKAAAFMLGLGGRITGQQISAEDLPTPEERPVQGASLIGGEMGQELIANRSGYGLQNGVAIISISGTLVHRGAWIGKSSGQTSYEGIAAQLDAALADDQVAAIALEMDSMGGQAQGCFDLSDRIRRADKPVRAFLAENACSGAYALASQADRITIAETGIAGSIGVVVMHADWSQKLAEDGVKITFIHAGERKTEGNPYEPLPDHVRAAIQAEVENTRRGFVQRVAAGRGNRFTEEDALATEAACFIGQEAVEAGLADEVADPRDAFEEFTREVMSRPFGRKQGGQNMARKNARAEAGNQTEENVEAVEAEASLESQSEGAEGGTEQESAEASSEPENQESVSEDDGAKNESVEAGAEKERISAILSLPQAKGRDELAKQLAFTTDLNPEACAVLLGAAPAGGGLSEKMKDPAAAGGSSVGVGDSDAAKILASYRQAGGRSASSKGDEK